MTETLSPRQLEAAQAVMRAAAYKREHWREFLDEDHWYSWQREGFDAVEPEVMTMAGNQSGKTMSGAYHDALDLTQRYPDWWTGFRFDHPIHALMVGVDAKQLGVLQNYLFGPLEDRHFAGGFVHRDEIQHRMIEWSRNTPGIASAVPIRSKHGMSRVNLRSYTQSKTGQATLTFAGTIYDLIHADEQPPDDLIGQFKVRLTNGNRGAGGRLRYTMTPELGPTAEVVAFMENPSRFQRLIGPVSVDECAHIRGEVRERLEATIPEHERDMRLRGIPLLGEGLIYPVAESRLKVPSFQPMPWMKRLKGIDIGYKHVGLAWMLFNPETGQRIVYRTEKLESVTVAEQCAALNGMWDDVPTVFPPDVNNTEKGSGDALRKIYGKHLRGRMLDFENEDGSRFVEPGLMQTLDWMRAGLWRVCDQGNEPYFREIRMYHRKNGKVVKENDHVMDATRYTGMMVARRGVQANEFKRKPQVRTLSQARRNGR